MIFNEECIITHPHHKWLLCIHLHLPHIFRQSQSVFSADSCRRHTNVMWKSNFCSFPLQRAKVYYRLIHPSLIDDITAAIERSISALQTTRRRRRVILRLFYRHCNSLQNQSWWAHVSDSQFGVFQIDDAIVMVEYFLRHRSVLCPCLSNVSLAVCLVFEPALV